MKLAYRRAMLSFIAAFSVACTSAPPEPAIPPAEPPAEPSATLPLDDTLEPAPTRLPVDLSVFGRLAYTAYAPGDVEIYLQDPGAQSVQLTDAPGFSLRPAWSPDGRYLSYLYIPPGAETPDLWLVDFEHSRETRQLTHGTSDFFSVPAWMSNGRALVYWGSDPSTNGTYIFAIDPESGLITNLTPDYPKWNSHPAPSPVDGRIAFVSDRPDGSSDKIWVMQADGSGLQLLAGEEGSFWEQNYPAWAPDGSRIAFFRGSFMAELLEGDEDSRRPGIWLVSLRDGAERLLFEMEAAFASQPPVWSPDGKWIAVARGVAAETDIWVLSLEDGQAVQISDLPGEETGVIWAPDSLSLLFTHVDARGRLTLYLAALDGSPPQVVFPGQDAGYAARRP